MESLHIAVPKPVKVFDVFRRCVVNHLQTEFLRQFAAYDTHFPKSVRVFFVNPPQAYMAVSHSLYNIGV